MSQYTPSLLTTMKISNLQKKYSGEIHEFFKISYGKQFWTKLAWVCLMVELIDTSNQLSNLDKKK